MKPYRVLFLMYAPYAAPEMQIAALSAYLKRMGCEVFYHEVNIFKAPEYAEIAHEAADAIERFKPDMVGFSTYDMNYRYNCEAAEHVKQIDPKIVTIAGGHHASVVPMDFMKFPYLDYVCIGEGELVMEELIGTLSGSAENPVPIDKIAGLCSRDEQGEMIQNRARDLLVDLDHLPFIDRDVIDALVPENGELTMFVGKGCPHKCTYCANDSMKHLYDNYKEYVRLRSPENVIEEIHIAAQRAPLKKISFLDDIFAMDSKWLVKFCDLYKENFPGIPFQCLLRPEMVNDKRMTILADAGCSHITMGVESGAEEYRRKMLKRRMSNNTILRAASIIKKHQVQVAIFMMVGFPEERFADMVRSLWLNFKVGANGGVQTGIFFPIKGTALYDLCVEKDLIQWDVYEKMVVYTYNSCLRNTVFRRKLIILFKWLNSAIPIVRNMRVDLVPIFFRQMRTILTGRLFRFN